MKPSRTTWPSCGRGCARFHRRTGAGVLSDVGRNAATGSPRYAHELDLPGLRSWPLKRYPYLIFYVEREDHIDVWRVLHGERDIPAWLHES